MATKDNIEKQGFITAELSTGKLYIGEKYKVFINNQENGGEIEIHARYADEWIQIDKKLINAIHEEINK